MMVDMDADRARYSLGALSSVTAEAIGEPGNRTFRLVLESGSASAYIWLEKNQLYQLAIHIQTIISSLPADSAREGSAPEPKWPGETVNLDFKVGKMAIGHDATSNSLLLLAHDVEEEDEETATVSGWLVLKQGEGLAEEALRVCAAGRPRCFLCGQPIDPDGHMCPRSNGHGPLQS